MDTLFDIPATPLPPLEQARRELNRAETSLESAETPRQRETADCFAGMVAVRVRALEAEAIESAFRKAAK